MQNFDTCNYLQVVKLCIQKILEKLMIYEYEYSNCSLKTRNPGLACQQCGWNVLPILLWEPVVVGEQYCL